MFGLRVRRGVIICGRGLAARARDRKRRARRLKRASSIRMPTRSSGWLIHLQKERLMNAQIVRTAIVLGLLSVIGPLAIDMYLAALPAIGKDFGASPGAVQQSLMAYMAAIAVCQLIYGPLSDMLGRKAPLYFGISVYIAGSVGAALAPSIEWLV